MASGWEVRPSLWFDANCLLPLIAGIPFYTTRHVDDSERWQQRFSALAPSQAMSAVSALRGEISEGAGKPLPAFLALWTSPAAVRGSATTELEALIAAVADPEMLPRLMQDTSPHWSQADEDLFRRARPHLLSALTGLRAAGLAEWWLEHAEAELRSRCAQLRPVLGPHDLVPLVERYAGISLPGRWVELCILRWAAPHAIRVTGVRFLGDVRYDSSTLVNNAVHELLHPPFPAQHPVVEQLHNMSTDPFLAQRFAARDRASGYNNWSSYVEEDAAQALDQFITNRIGTNAQAPVTRWGASDGGMHVLAVLLHETLVRGEFDPDKESYADFLSGAFADHDLWPADLGHRYLQVTQAT